MILDLSKTAGGAGAPGTDPIKDGDVWSFNDDVVRASMKVPVIVDFWATWCGPCKQLTPLLERLVREAQGRVRMVKIDIDQNQDLAAQLRIQSVPTVYAFVGGRPVDGFVGAQPESEVRAFIERLKKAAATMMGGPAGGEMDVVQQAQAALDAGEAATASQMFARIVAQEPSNAKAQAGLIRSRVATGDIAGARTLLKGLPADLANKAEIVAAASAVELAEMVGQVSDLAALQKRIAADPTDLQAKLDLALALFGRGRSEAAIDTLLEMIRADREWNDGAARRHLLKIFDALGPSHPLTIASRRKLSSILFS